MKSRLNTKNEMILIEIQKRRAILQRTEKDRWKTALKILINLTSDVYEVK